jgi:exopolysaccharide biosynthesis polyprenyl glycosylphosphotransferase
MKRWEIFLALLRIPLDAAALFAAFILAYYIRDQFVMFGPAFSYASRFQISGTELTLPFDHYLRYISFIIPLMVVIFAISGLYMIRLTTPWYRRFLEIVVGVSVGEGAILLLFLLKKDFFLPRSTIIYSWVLAIALVFLGRVLLHLTQLYLRKFDIGVFKVGIIGSNGVAADVVRQLTQYRGNAYHVVFTMDTAELCKVDRKIQHSPIDELLVASATISNDEIIALRNLCLERHIAFSFVPSLFTELPCAYDVELIGTLPRVEVRPTPLDGWGKVCKRLFDIIVVTLLIILFSPIYLIIAIWIKLSSPGPLIYRHRRIGYQKKPIYVWKFRTLKREYCTGDGYDGDAVFQKVLEENPALKAEWEANFKLKNDFRVSTPGKILRKTSLDELPQFFNVFIGSLSLVGPRPIVEEEVEKYGQRSRILFTVKPGVTGLWQVSGRNDVSYNERILLDTQYIEQWNLWRDIVILFKTAWQLIRKNGNGAY